jgi:cytidylate kinase
VPTAARRSSPVVAIDGPSGAGKSSVARGVAKALGYRYLDTGAMYRAVTWWMLRHDVDIHDAVQITAHATLPKIETGTDPANPTVTVDGLDVSGSIRGRDVTAAVSPVAAVPAVRARLVEIQRQEIGDGAIVVEGRDIASVVVPDAELKVYLTAAPEARAARRSAELSDRATSADGEALPTTLHATKESLLHRDSIDSSRAASPLTQAEGAVEVDSTDMSLHEVVELVVALFHSRVSAGATS